MSAVSITTGPRRGWKSVSTWIGAVIVGIATICALFAPLLAPHDPFAQDLGKRLLVPFWMEGADPSHLLGTDQLGRDYLSRLIYGCRISMLIGVTVTIVSAVIGIAIGVLGGFLEAGSTTPSCSPSRPASPFRSYWWHWRSWACSAVPCIYW
jgi:peptide/nickel transport system permease protein